ncbi:MAG: flavodoxin family protein [Peptoniphilus sp.]|nr:flavodoxin family protein [Peptoniphilus sp.]
MKILAIMGSSRKNKNTHKLLDIFKKRVVKEKDEYKEVILKDLKFSGCISCYGCAKKPFCIVKDDLTEVYKDIEEADMIILATPIYFNSLSGLAKNFVDRTQVYWCRKYILKLPPIKEKIGVALINGGAPRQEHQFTGSELVLDHFFKVTSCKKHSIVEIDNTDEYPINEENEKIMELLDKVDYDFKENRIYRLWGGEITSEIE